MVQVPTAMAVTVVPLIVHTEGVAELSTTGAALAAPAIARLVRASLASAVMVTGWFWEKSSDPADAVRLRTAGAFVMVPSRVGRGLVKM